MRPTSGKCPVEASDRETSITIGSVKVTIKVADITMENTDAIINSTTADFQFTGNVSRAIEKVAGNTVIEECKALGKIAKGFAVTQAGNLPCHFIFHVDAPKDVNGWKKVIKNVLADANQMNLQSISFPALGTGVLQLNPDDIAAIMIRAVKDYSKRRSQTLHQINICIFQQDMLCAFEEAAMNEPNKHKSLIARFLNALKRNQTQMSPKVVRRVQSQEIEKPIRPNVLPRSLTYSFEALSDECQTIAETAKPLGRDQTRPRRGGIMFKSIEEDSNNFPEGLPRYWIPLDYKEKFYKIPLLPGNEKYSHIVSQLHDAGCPSDYLKVERIQNPKQYQLYEVLKSQMEHPNEQELWHGTSVDVIDQINANGFNRSWCGKNATLRGKGCYFATRLSYSKNFAEPDSNGFQYIYLCKVLAGEYTQGQENILEPPAKHPMNKYILYDSVVDDIKNPTMYVIFKDGAAYPEYLITFKSE